MANTSISHTTTHESKGTEVSTDSCIAITCAPTHSQKPLIKELLEHLKTSPMQVALRAIAGSDEVRATLEVVGKLQEPAVSFEHGSITITVSHQSEKGKDSSFLILSVQQVVLREAIIQAAVRLGTESIKAGPSAKDQLENLTQLVASYLNKSTLESPRSEIKTLLGQFLSEPRAELSTNKKSPKGIVPKPTSPKPTEDSPRTRLLKKLTELVAELKKPISIQAPPAATAATARPSGAQQDLTAIASRILASAAEVKALDGILNSGSTSSTEAHLAISRLVTTLRSQFARGLSVGNTDAATAALDAFNVVYTALAPGSYGRGIPSFLQPPSVVAGAGLSNLSAPRSLLSKSMTSGSKLNESRDALPNVTDLGQEIHELKALIGLHTELKDKTQQSGHSLLDKVNHHLDKGTELASSLLPVERGEPQASLGLLLDLLRNAISIRWDPDATGARAFTKLIDIAQGANGRYDDPSDEAYADKYLSALRVLRRGDAAMETGINDAQELLNSQYGFIREFALCSGLYAVNLYIAKFEECFGEAKGIDSDESAAIIKDLGTLDDHFVDIMNFLPKPENQEGLSSITRKVLTELKYVATLLYLYRLEDKDLLKHLDTIPEPLEETQFEEAAVVLQVINNRASSLKESESARIQDEVSEAFKVVEREGSVAAFIKDYKSRILDSSQPPTSFQDVARLASVGNAIAGYMTLLDNLFIDGIKPSLEALINDGDLATADDSNLWEQIGAAKLILRDGAYVVQELDLIIETFKGPLEISGTFTSNVADDNQPVSFKTLRDFAVGFRDYTKDNLHCIFANRTELLKYVTWNLAHGETEETKELIQCGMQLVGEGIDGIEASENSTNSDI